MERAISRIIGEPRQALGSCSIGGTCLRRRRDAFFTTILGTILPWALAAQSLPPIRPLGPIIDRSIPIVRSAAAARELPDGKVLLNDILAHRLYLFDSALVTSTIVLDSTVGAANSYGDAPGGIIPYRGDSTLFVDPSSISLLVIDPKGRLGRVMAGPRLADIPFLVGGPYGTPGFDLNGRLVYRASNPTPETTTENEVQAGVAFVDSAPIVRLNLSSRKTDTIAVFQVPKSNLKFTRTAEGRIRPSVLRSALPIVDDWALLPDGSVAAVRGKDFHLDIVQADGSRKSFGKIAFPWRRLSDDDKHNFVDSVRLATDRTIAKARASIAARLEGTGVTPPEPIEFEYLPPTELPDYFPPFEPNSTHADQNGILWIRTTERFNGQPVYYLVSRRGALLDRVQLPPGRIIAGFGRDQIIYLAFIDPGGGVRLERVRLR